MSRRTTSQNKHCRGLCVRYKVRKTKLAQSWYSIQGAKYCSRCGEFIKWEGINCPCCGGKLRTRPRTNLGIDKYRQRKKVVYQ